MTSANASSRYEGAWGEGANHPRCRGPRAGRHLTERQERFANLIAIGTPGGQAYREVYSADAKGSTARANACHLLKRTAIAQRVDELKAAQERIMIHDGARLRDHVIARLLEESAIEGGQNQSARVRALELLGKLDIVCLFAKDKPRFTDERTPEELQRLLLERLATWCGATGSDPDTS